jgi:hypothetical protein
MRTMEDYYQIMLKAEEKLDRKQSQRTRGRSLNRGKGIVHDKAQNPNVETEKPHNRS